MYTIFIFYIYLLIAYLSIDYGFGIVNLIDNIYHPVEKELIKFLDYDMEKLKTDLSNLERSVFNFSIS